MALLAAAVMLRRRLLPAVVALAAAAGCAPTQSLTPEAACVPPMHVSELDEAVVTAEGSDEVRVFRDATVVVVVLCGALDGLPDQLPTLRASGDSAAAATGKLVGTDPVGVTTRGTDEQPITSLALIFPPLPAEELSLRGPGVSAEASFHGPAESSPCPHLSRPAGVELVRCGRMPTIRWVTPVTVTGTNTSTLVAEVGAAATEVGAAATAVGNGGDQRALGAYVLGQTLDGGRLVLDVGFVAQRDGSPGTVALTLQRAYDYRDAERGIRGDLPVTLRGIKLDEAT